LPSDPCANQFSMFYATAKLSRKGNEITQYTNRGEKH